MCNRVSSFKFAYFKGSDARLAVNLTGNYFAALRDQTPVTTGVGIPIEIHLYGVQTNNIVSVKKG